MDINFSEIIDLLQPETDLERALLAHPEVQEGLDWGEPRYGHPEGKVLYHIPEVYQNIDRLWPAPPPDMRQQLRLIALLHDTFKFREDKSTPRDWSRHHGMLAKQFAEQFIADPVILDILELHDEAYYAWRLEVLNHEPSKAADRFQLLLDRVGHCLQIYYYFFKCDTATGDKTQAPVKWFEKKQLPLNWAKWQDLP